MVTSAREWKEVQLGDVTHELTGSIVPLASPDSVFTEYSMPAYDAGRKPVRVPGSSMLSARRIITSPCVLVNKLNVRKRRVWIVPQPANNAVSSFEFVPLASSELDLEYLRNLALSNDFTEHLESSTSGTSNSQKRVTAEDIFSFQFLMPQFPEQRAIAEVLSGFDEHLANLDELIAKKKNIRDGALDAMFSGKKRMRGFQNPFLRTKLLEYSEVLTGLTYNPADVQTSGVLVLRSSNIQDDVISLEDTVFVRASAATSPSVQAGDVLLCVRNGSTRLIGKTAQISEDVPRGTTFGAFMAILRALPAIDPSYLYWFTKSSAFREQVREVLGATINQITKRDLAYFTISIPESIAEQKAIAEVLSSMDEEIRVLQAERLKVGVLKLGAMDDLLTGRVRLPVEEVDA